MKQGTQAVKRGTGRKAAGRALLDGAEAGYRRHLELDGAIPEAGADSRRRYEALARTLRDLIAPRWLRTREVHHRRNPKRVCYLSMEFLLGRSLLNNIGNLGAEGIVRECLGPKAASQWPAIVEAEPDALLG